VVTSRPPGSDSGHAPPGVWEGRDRGRLEDRAASTESPPRDGTPGAGSHRGASTTDAEAGGGDGSTAHRRRRGRSGKPRGKALPLWQEVIVLLAMALVLAVVVKAFFVQAFFVPSGSMEPQFVQGDRILVEKISYWNDDIHRGDVIVFDDPGGWLGATESREASGLLQRGLEAVGLYPTGGHLVKRVIGVGGDRVECCDDRGRVSVNGVPLAEGAYLQRGVAPSETPFDVEVPEDALWVMGDNRLESGDSRVHIGDVGEGFVPAEDVVGKVWAIVWPVDRLELLDRPAVFDAAALEES